MVSEMEKQTAEASEAKAPKQSAYDCIYNIGEYIFSVILTIALAIKTLVLNFIDRNEHRFKAIAQAVRNGFKKLGAKLVSPFVRYRKATKLGFSEIGRICRENGVFAAICAVIRMLGRTLFGKRGLAYSIFNYALPVVCTVMLFNIVTYANNMTYAIKLDVNGDFVGYIENENVFTEAERIVQQRINYMDENTKTVTFTPVYQLETVDYGTTLTKYQLADKLLTSMGAEIEHAYGMYIGNSFYGALVEKDKVEATLEALLDVYRTGAQNEKVAFELPITYEPGLYLSESIVTEESIIEIITEKRTTADYYTVVNGDSPLGIAQKLDIPLDELKRLNSEYFASNNMYVGDKILITQEEPFLAVTVTRTEIYNENTQYETSYIDDSTRYEGSSVVTQDGVYGVDRVTADVSYINGVETRRKVLDRVTLAEPTTKIVALGTKPHPTNLDVSIQNVEVGQFYWPVGGPTGGQISELPYGYGGYYGHQGIDISAPYGTPIIAADSGTVTYSGWLGGYGYCIKIKHDSGIETLYGHASYLHVNVGDRVTQGQQIADVGSTGYSTGNHLHFEVRINGICMYPLNYLPAHQFAPWCVRW